MYEFIPLVKRDGLKSKKAQVGALHAVINDVTVIGAAFNWWSDTNILISSVIALPATMFAAYLGGSLVYVYGMGFRGGQAKAKKAQ
jgi:hypothetical protein